MTMSFLLAMPDDDYNQCQWEYVLRHWMPDQIYTYGPGELHYKSRVWHGRRHVTTLDDLPSGASIVVTAAQNGTHIQGKTSLFEFEHPDDVVYVFGADVGHMELTNQLFDCWRDVDAYVYVPVLTDNQMYSWVAASVIAYDRLSKHRRSS